VKLVIPEMEKVGKLRQSSTPIAGRSYWMAFSNSGRRVRPGDRVDVQIGHFHAENLVVE
jgi:transcription elongation factor